MSNSNDIDLDQFARLFDAALASNNPTVKKALRNFMLVASIAEAETTEAFGPFTQMQKMIESLKNEIHSLEYEVKISRGTRNNERYYGNCSQYIDDYPKYSGTTTETSAKFNADYYSIMKIMKGLDGNDVA